MRNDWRRNDSVSVSYETRRQLNTMRTNSGHQSVDDLLKALIKNTRLTVCKEMSTNLEKELTILLQ